MLRRIKGEQQSERTAAAAAPSVICGDVSPTLTHVVHTFNFLLQEPGGNCRGWCWSRARGASQPSSPPLDAQIQICSKAKVQSLRIPPGTWGGVTPFKNEQIRNAPRLQDGN